MENEEDGSIEIEFLEWKALYPFVDKTHNVSDLN